METTMTQFTPYTIDIAPGGSCRICRRIWWHRPNCSSGRR